MFWVLIINQSIDFGFGDYINVSVEAGPAATKRFIFREISEMFVRGLGKGLGGKTLLNWFYFSSNFQNVNFQVFKFPNFHFFNIFNLPPRAAGLPSREKPPKAELLLGLPSLSRDKPNDATLLPSKSILQPDNMNQSTPFSHNKPRYNLFR